MVVILHSLSLSLWLTVGSKIGVYELSLLSSAYAEKLHANGATVLVGKEPVEAGHVRRGLGDEIARACQVNSLYTSLAWK